MSTTDTPKAHYRVVPRHEAFMFAVSRALQTGCAVNVADNSVAEFAACAKEFGAEAVEVGADFPSMVTTRAQDLERANTELAAEVARLKGERDYDFGILKDCHRILGMTCEQSYSLIPGEIDEWLASHKLVKAKEVAATDRAVLLRFDLQAAHTVIARIREAWENGTGDAKSDIKLRDAVLAAPDSVRDEIKRLEGRVAELEEENERLENLTATGIHTCHDQCQRPLCVARRQIAALEADLVKMREERDAKEGKRKMLLEKLRESVGDTREANDIAELLLEQRDEAQAQLQAANTVIARMREALELAAKADTSQTCSPGNESIALAAMDTLAITPETARDRIKELEWRLEESHRKNAVHAMDAYTENDRANKSATELEALRAALASKDKELAEASERLTACALSLGLFDLQYHSLRNAATRLVLTRRSIGSSGNQTSVLTAYLDELSDKAKAEPPKWPDAARPTSTAPDEQDGKREGRV